MGRTGRDLGLYFVSGSFAYESRTEVKTVCTCAYMSVEVSFFMLRLWARLDAATGSSTG